MDYQSTSMRSLSDSVASACGSVQAISDLVLPGDFDTLLQAVNSDLDLEPDMAKLDKNLMLSNLAQLEIDAENKAAQADVGMDPEALLQAMSIQAALNLLLQ